MTQAHDEQHPREVFADAVANGQIHPALAGYLAHLDGELGKLFDGFNASLIDPQAKDHDDDDGGDDAGDKRPDETGAGPSTPGRKVTPATVASKAGPK